MIFDYNLDGKYTDEKLEEFADKIQELADQIGFKVSARGWCYQLEQAGVINKDQFDKVENIINKCREKGVLPIDFTAEEEGRKFSGVEKPHENSPIQEMREWIEAAMQSEIYYTPNWWAGEEYYIQMLVEKIDLKTLFEPVCKKYHIPIATSKGWSSMLQRAEYARRFQQAEEQGLTPVLLYCGDHDPDGLRISTNIRNNLEALKNIKWEDGETGYDPGNLIIMRFGLNYDFIVQNKLTWINNLITGSGGELAREVNGKIVAGLTKNGKPHKNFRMPYVQEYLKTVGVRKCEANAIVPMPDEARALVEAAITRYLGDDAAGRFEEKRLAVFKEVKAFRDRTGLTESLQKALDLIDNNDNES